MTGSHRSEAKQVGLELSQPVPRGQRSRAGLQIIKYQQRVLSALEQDPAKG